LALYVLEIFLIAPVQRGAFFFKNRLTKGEKKVKFIKLETGQVQLKIFRVKSLNSARLVKRRIFRAQKTKKKRKLFSKST